MDLFEMNNGRAFPSTHALLIEPFKSIWSKDLSAEKGEAMKVFTYIELMCNPKKSNPFFGFDQDIRSAKVKKEVYGNADQPTTSDMLLGVMAFNELLENSSVGYSLYLSSMEAASTLKDYLKSINLDERTNGGSAVYKPVDVTRALKEIPEVIKGLRALREKIHEELTEDAKMRNQREVGDYEK